MYGPVIELSGVCSLCQVRHASARGALRVVFRFLPLGQLYGSELEAELARARLVFAPSLFVGPTFPPFMRIAQCVNHGVAIVVEASERDVALLHEHAASGGAGASGNGLDAQVAVAGTLGGVHFQLYDDLVSETASVLRDDAAVRLTALQRSRWSAFRDRLYGWNGTHAGLRHVLTTHGS